MYPLTRQALPERSLVIFPLVTPTLQGSGRRKPPGLSLPGSRSVPGVARVAAKPGGSLILRLPLMDEPPPLCRV